MDHITAAPAPRQLPAHACNSQTIAAGEVQPAAHNWRWVVRPQEDADRVGHLHGGALQIDGTIYAFEQTVARSNGHVWLIADLRQSAGEHWRLSFGDDRARCDCPHATYRGIVCKHITAVLAAFEWLQVLEHLEDERDRAESALVQHLMGAADPLSTVEDEPLILSVK